MANTDLTEAQQKEMKAALLKGETPPNFGGVTIMDPKTGEWRKATKEEADDHYARVDRPAATAVPTP
jgi:hypothetical protein